MNNKNSLVTKLAFLSVSFMVTSAYAIQGSLPQLKAALGISQTQSEYLVTTPSFAVMIFVVLSPLLQQWFNISSLEINENETRMQIDLRIPVTVDRDNLLAKLSKQVAAYDLKYVHFDYLAPLYVPKDSKLVRTLMKVYKEQTGDVDAEPQISGGATFARTMNNCVAFGGMLPTTPDYMHQANEQWPLSDMYKAMEIYAQAIKKLCVD